MKGAKRLAVLSAAIVAVIHSPANAAPRNLVWALDNNGPWDTVSPNWFDETATITSWNNANPDSAYFGNPIDNAGTLAANVFLAENITVQNITLANTGDGRYFNILDQGDFNQTLTLNGNISKVANKGGSQISLSNAMVLSAASHTIAVRDTGNVNVELTFGNAITGSGSLTFDNAFDIAGGAGTSGFDAFGTTLLTVDSNYTGGTFIKSGRVGIASSNALGTGTTVISDSGVLSFGVGGPGPVGGFNYTAPIVVTRNTYTGGVFGNRPDAIITNNGSGSTTITGPLIIDSTDGRIRADTSIINLPNPILAGANVGTASVATLDGDFSGSINLGGDNSGTTAVGAIRIIGGVEVYFTDINNLGGTGKALQLVGGTLHIPTNITSDTQLNIATTNFGGGFDVEVDNSFTFAGNYTGGSMGKRGLGTLNISGSNTLNTGATFFDSGVVNFTGTGTNAFGGLRLRSSTVNIGDGTITTNNFTSIGVDSAGTGGQPDKGTINIFGTAVANFANTDFNISDNPNTAGTLTVGGTANVTVGGNTYAGKALGAAGTLNISGGTYTSAGTAIFGYTGGTGNLIQSGGTLILNQNGPRSLSLGDNVLTNNGNNVAGSGSLLSTGTFTKTGGYTYTAGEMFVGNGQGVGTFAGQGQGTFTMSAGTLLNNSWFVVGRQSSGGTVDFSGGTWTKQTGGNFAIGDGASPTPSSFTIRNGATLNVTNANGSGEFWLGNGGATATFSQSGSATSTTVNNWFAIGRAGGKGTFDLSGGTFTKQGTNNSYVGESTAFGSSITVRNGATFNINNGDFWVANGGASTGLLTLQDAGTVAQFNGVFLVGRSGIGTFDFQGGTVNKNGGNASYIGEANNAVVSTMNVGTAAFWNGAGTSGTNGTGEFWVGQAGGKGLLNINGGKMIVNNWLALGRANAASVGTINLNSGTLIKQGGGNIAIGSGGTGYLYQNGGNFFSNSTYVGEASNGTLTLSGGNSTFTGTFSIGHNGAPTGFMTVNGTANVILPDVVFGRLSGTGGGTLNLDGGTVTANSFVNGLGTGQKVLNFNGTQVKAASSKTGFIAGLNAANVGTFGAKIDTGSFTVTSTQALLHLAAAPANDGGLTKSGTGTLQLGGANAYTGQTTVVAGSLVLTNNGTTNAQAPLFNNTATGTDIQGGKVVLAYSGTATTPLLTVDSLLTTSYNNNGFNNTTSQVRSTTATNLIGLGYQDDGTAVTVARTYYGDANLDGTVDTVDFAHLISGFGNSFVFYFTGDFNYDNVVDSVDFNRLVANYGSPTLGALPGALPGTTPGATPGALVPEPTTLSLVGLAAVGLLRRRRTHAVRA